MGLTDNATCVSWSTRQLACSRAILAYLQLGNMKIGKRYSLGQSPKVAEHAVEWRRVLSLARSIGAYREALCVVKIWK